jgi:hypothetical protein
MTLGESRRWRANRWSTWWASKRRGWCRCIAKRWQVPVQPTPALPCRLLEQWDRLHHLQDTLRKAGWQLQRVDGERGESDYRVYALTPPVD